MNLRISVASALDGIPPKRKPKGYDWYAPRHILVTHAAFRPHRTRPDEIELFNEDTRVWPEGRVLRFREPFFHTTHGAFFRVPLATRRTAARGRSSSRRYRASRG